MKRSKKIEEAEEDYNGQYKLDDAKRTLYARLINKPDEILSKSEKKLKAELAKDEAIESTVSGAFYHDFHG